MAARPYPPNNPLAAELRAEHAKAGGQLKGLAGRLGLRVERLSEYMSGTRAPLMDVAFEWARKLGRRRNHFHALAELARRERLEITSGEPIYMIATVDSIAPDEQVRLERERLARHPTSGMRVVFQHHLANATWVELRKP